MSLEAYAIYKSFGEVEALKNVDLVVNTGEFFTLLGPSGCGKTTLLRIIAGLELPDSGRVMLMGQDITGLPANKRHVNTVFQSYALFPHLSNYENIAFGLRSRKTPEAEVKRRVGDALALLRLETMADRFPHQLSGGQRQRVALARALVNEPDVLLLDEPMSALDAKLRTHLQVELRQLQKRLGKTFILVTHDQDEALTVSDRIAVMHDGVIVQSGTAQDVYERPTNRFVAEFLGTANLIEATRKDNGLETILGPLYTELEPDWTKGMLAIRPESIRLRDQKPEVNGVLCTVRDAFYRGNHLEVWLEPGPLSMRTAPHRRMSPGDQIWVELLPEGLVALNEE